MEALSSDTPILVKRYGCEDEFARELEEKFNITDTFRAERNLVEVLIELLETRKKHENKLDEASNDWLQNLKEVKSIGDENGWKLAAATGHGGNPLGGFIGEYKVAATFLQASQHFKTQAYAIKSLLLASMIYNSNIEHAPIAGEIGAVLRGETKAVNINALKTFPCIGEMHLDKYIAKLREKIQENNNEDNRIVRIVSKILDIKIKRVRTKSIPGKPAYPKEPKKVLPWVPDLRKPGVKIDVIDVEADDELEEAPSNVTIVTIENSLDDGTSLDDDEVESRLNESRHWIARQESLVAVDKGRLTPAEKRQVASTLKTLLTDHNKTTRAAAGVLGLSYCLARKWTECLKIRVDENHLNAEAGLYKKKIIKPKGGYSPGTDAEYLERRGSELTLTLPDPIARWLHDDIKGTGKLSELMDVDEASMKDAVNQIMDKMRCGGKYPRIRIEKIQAALPLELKLKTNDISMIYHILNEGGLSAPSISYYIVQPCADIESVYGTVTRQMLDV